MISVIIPVYNVEDSLRRCIESIISQNYSDIEILLIDDGSTDGSGIICDSYVKIDNRISVIHQTNQGLSGARNTGILKSQGDYIAFVDGDDWVEPNMFSVLKDAIDYSSADVVCCNYYTEYNCNNQIELIITSSLTEDNNETNLRNMLSGKYGNAVWNKLWRRSLFTDGLLFPDGHTYEDGLIQLKIMEKCQRVACITDALYHYCYRTGSITNSPTINNICDRWMAEKSKFDRYAHKSNTFYYLCLALCASAIKYAWQWSYGNTKADIKKNEKAIVEMRCFANDTKNTIMNNKGYYSIQTILYYKIACARNYYLSLKTGYLLNFIRINIRKIESFFTKKCLLH